MFTCGNSVSPRGEYKWSKEEERGKERLLSYEAKLRSALTLVFTVIHAEAAAHTVICSRRGIKARKVVTPSPCKLCSYFQKLCSFVLMFWNQFVYFIHLDAGWSTKSTKWGTKTWLNLPRGGQKSLRGGQKFFARCARDILNRASRDFLYFVSFVPFFLNFVPNSWEKFCS